ncbi:hypothetical protein [Candidatus Electronema sp. JC]|uniref:hypothetical protein n=1 Tax=Candidatus Electronema sp. JC TaxID=3401570 RepID=UPI003AA902BF
MRIIFAAPRVEDLLQMQASDLRPAYTLIPAGEIVKRYCGWPRCFPAAAEAGSIFVACGLKNYISVKRSRRSLRRVNTEKAFKSAACGMKRKPA